MKILVISSYKDTYNSVRPEGELFIGLHHSGAEVEIMTQGDAPFAQRFRDQGLKVIPFHPSQKFSWEAVKIIRKTLKEGRHQILHLFNNKAIVNGIIAAWNLPVKIVTYRGYTGNIHWYDPSCYLTHLNPRIDKITCVSDSVKEVFEAQLFFEKSKAVTVSKGHNLTWYDNVNASDLSEFDLPKNAFVVSCVANSRKMKGISFLLKALQFLPEDAPIYLLLLGRNMDKPENRKLIKGTTFEKKVIFPGFRTDVLELVAGSNVFVLPSIFGEGRSKALIEAMGLGKACIATTIAGNRNLAIDGENALTVPPGDYMAISKAIRKYWENPDLCKKMGRQAKAHIKNKFNVERSVQELKKVYEELIYEA